MSGTPSVIFLVLVELVEKKIESWKSYPTNALKQKWGRKGKTKTFAPPNYYLFINASG